MSAIKKSQKLFRGVKLFGNFLERPVQVGDIVVNDDGQHLNWGNIQDVIDGFSLTGKTATANKADLKFTKESNVEVTLGGKANAEIGKSEIQLEFKAQDSALVVLNQVEVVAAKLGLIVEALSAYWQEKGFDKGRNRHKYQFIVETYKAASGTLIYSHDKKNKVVLKARNDVPISSLAVLGSGNMEYVSNTKSTLEIISTTPITPLYRAVRFRANGNFEVVG